MWLKNLDSQALALALARRTAELARHPQWLRMEQPAGALAGGRPPPPGLLHPHRSGFGCSGGGPCSSSGGVSSADDKMHKPYVYSLCTFAHLCDPHPQGGA